MRVRISLLALLLTLALIVHASSAQPSTILQPNERVGTGLRVRAEPNGGAETIAVLRPGDRVLQIGAIPYWYQIRLVDGTEGWALKGYLSVASGPGLGPSVGEVNLTKLTIHFIDVGIGDAILIDYGDKEIFIDGGMGTNIAWKYVKDLIQDPIELAIVTHGDADHWKGMARIIGLEPKPRTPNFRVTEFWDAGYNRDCNIGKGQPGEQARQGYLDFIAGVQGKAARFLRPLSATYTPMVKQANPSLTKFVTLPELPGFKFQILHADAAPLGSIQCSYLINNASIVFKLLVGQHTFLFTGDANGKERDGPDKPGHVEAKLLELEARLPGILKADLLKVPHHGSETASTTAFLNKVRPRFAIISASPKHHLPRLGTLKRYDAVGAVVLRTDQDRKSDNDHIVCFFTIELALDCNYADVPQ